MISFKTSGGKKKRIPRDGNNFRLYIPRVYTSALLATSVAWLTVAENKEKKMMKEKICLGTV